MNSSSFATRASLVLKSIGAVLLLVFLIDFAVLLSSADYANQQWLLSFTTQIVDRGFLSLLGVGFILLGTWLASKEEEVGMTQPTALRWLAVTLAALLSLGFVFLIPLHVGTVKAASETQLADVKKQVEQAQSKLDFEAQQAKANLDSQIAQLEQAVKSGQVQGEQLTQVQGDIERLKKIKADPKNLDNQIAEKKKEAQKQIDEQKGKGESQISGNAMRTGLRTGLDSFLLALAQGIVAWSGFRQIKGR
jgi:hypothetical protein